MSDELQQNAPAAGAQLQLSDLLLTAQVIQLASQRGAFRAEEFTQVGSLYDRLVAFLNESGALKRTPDASQASAQPTSGETVGTAPADQAPEQSDAQG